MKLHINQVEYEYYNHIRDLDEIRMSFIQLIKKTFCIDFTSWYDAGYWSDKYEPHVLVKDGIVVAAISANHMTFMVKGEEKHYLQLGGVATAKELRKQGLGRWLMEQVLASYKDQYDYIYLYANDSVTTYYPKYGFIEADQYEAICDWSAIVEADPIQIERAQTETAERNKMNIENINIEKLDLTNPIDLDKLLTCYEQSNPFSALPCVKCKELLMFYCLNYYKNNLYYLSEYNLVAIVEYDSDVMLVNDVYGGNEHTLSLLDVIAAIAKEDKMGEKLTKVQLGFAPANTSDWNIQMIHEEDTTLFFLHGAGDPCKEDEVRFPSLSHT